MTTASKLTLLRVALIPVFMAVFLLGSHWVALAIFILASVTDFCVMQIRRRETVIETFFKNVCNLESPREKRCLVHCRQCRA